MKTAINIFWFRRDLRLHDNVGLYHALSSGKPVLPIFIFDPEILDKLPEDDARVYFIYQLLKGIHSGLEDYGSSIKVCYNTPEKAFKQLLEEYTIDTVYTNHDYEPYAITRDKTIEDLLQANNINFKTFKDQVIFERDEIVKKDGTPYKVYTPYSKQWIACFKTEGVNKYPSETLQEQFLKTKSFPILSLKDLGFKPPKQQVESFTLNTQLVDQYEATRNFPAIKGTSKLGTHLRFGTVSIRRIVKFASKHNNITFLKELIWREFFMQILWHFPHTVTKAFKPQYDTITWRNDKTEFKRWCNGNTGYPLVDAGMRELNQTGFMHNRVRMLVGSFLCKHLLIDWRWGEAYFAEKLHDFELSSNIGNWQWVAGCGVDAAPYFRIFNPTTQIEKFDKQLEYIKQWVPEFQELTYAKPMVDHKMARERCLEVYKTAVAKL